MMLTRAGTVSLLTVVLGTMVGGTTLRADLYVPASRNSPPGPLESLRHFSNAGVNLGELIGLGGESVDAFTAGPNQHLYTVENTLGAGSISEITTSGALVNFSPASMSGPLGMPRGAAVGFGGNFYVGSETFGAGSLTGVLEYNTTLGYVGNAIASVVARDLAFGPDNKLYVSTSTSITRYQKVGGVISKDLSFGLAFGGNIEFRPGDSHLYIAGTGIDQYDLSGNYVETLVAPGSGGMGSVWGYSFGNDGILYVTDNGTSRHLVRFNADTGAYLDTSAPLPAALGFATFMVFVAPEPGTMGLLAAGGLLLLRRRRRGMAAG